MENYIYRTFAYSSRPASGTLSIKKQERPMSISFRSEIGSRGWTTNDRLTVTLKAWVAGMKVGCSEPCSLFDEGTSCQTSYPGGNLLAIIFLLLEI